MLGLLFLKYVSDSFERRHQELAEEFGNPQGDSFIEDSETRAEAIEDRDEYASRKCSGCPKRHGGPNF